VCSIYIYAHMSFICRSFDFRSLADKSYIHKPYVIYYRMENW